MASRRITSERFTLFREWSGVCFGLCGTLLAIAGFIRAGQATQRVAENEGRTRALQVDHLLSEAWDLMGGRPGTTLIYAFSQDAGNLEFARRKIEEALVLDPMNSKVHRINGVCMEAFGKLDDALTSYDKALQLSPDSVATLINRGIALTDKNRLPEALESFRRAATFDENRVISLINIGALMWKSGYRDEAKTLFVEANKVLASGTTGLAIFDSDRIRQLLEEGDYNQIHLERLRLREMMRPPGMLRPRPQMERPFRR